MCKCKQFPLNLAKRFWMGSIKWGKIVQSWRARYISRPQGMIESDFALIKYSDEHKVTWDRVVCESKNGNFLHSRDYMDYHAHRFDEQSVIVLKQGKPITVFPCNRVNEIIVSPGGLTYGGLIYGRKLHAVDVLE